MFDNYAKIDDQLPEENKAVYNKTPDLSIPIDVCLSKQEKS